MVRLRHPRKASRTGSQDSSVHSWEAMSHGLELLRCALTESQVRSRAALRTNNLGLTHYRRRFCDSGGKHTATFAEREDFAQLANAFSIDPMASDRGYMAMIDIATLRPEFREALKGTADRLLE